MNDLKQTNKQISVNDAHKNYENIINLRKFINRNFWQLVNELKYAREHKTWIKLDHESWESFLALPEIDLNSATVKDYIYIFNKVSKYIKTSDMSDKMIQLDIDIGKLKIIASKINDQNAEELLLKAKNLSRSDLILEIQKKSLQERNLTFEPKVYNIWNFADNDNFGITYFGEQPPGEIFNLLYYYTNENDLVYDTFAGGGLVNDVCIKMNRQCYSTDIKPTREFIKQTDITKELPDIKPNLIYLDPPYPIISKSKYSTEITDLSNMSIENYFITINYLMKQIKNKYSNVVIAFIIGGTSEISGGLDYGFEIYKILKEYFIPVRRIIVPYSTQNYQAYHVIRAKEGKYMLNLYRDLMVFKSYG